MVRKAEQHKPLNGDAISAQAGQTSIRLLA